MKRIKSIIENNKGIEFVVITHNKEEFETLRDILVELDYEYAIPLAPLYEMMNNIVEDDGYNIGWRISESRGIAYNESIEHWKQYYSDILEINRNGELVFIE